MKYLLIKRFYSSNKKQSLVIIGAGWGGFRVAQDVDKTKYNVSLISPRNHFLFTPLLPSTAVGTLEFRCIEEPVRTIPGLVYHQANCSKINYVDQTISCTGYYDSNYSFIKKYDVLVIAAGAETNTFNISGVSNNPNVFFLKSLSDARAIRNKLIESFEKAANLTNETIESSYTYNNEIYKNNSNDLKIKEMVQKEIERLLTFVVVGGGPTNVEFTAELHDFLMKDVAAWYGDLKSKVKIILVEANGNILGTFNSALVKYVDKLLKSRNVKILTSTSVTKIIDGTESTNSNYFPFYLNPNVNGTDNGTGNGISTTNINNNTNNNIDSKMTTTVNPLDNNNNSKSKNIALLSNKEEIPFGMMIWSTGIKPVSFIQSLSSDILRSQGGRLKIDDYCRIMRYNSETNVNVTVTGSANDTYKTMENIDNVFAIGDCAAHYQKPLPALAQVASQQGIYIASILNKINHVKDLPHTSYTTPTTTATATSTISKQKTPSPSSEHKPFIYSHLGSMASVGSWKGVVDTSAIETHHVNQVIPPVTGFLAFLLWRAAYWTKQVSIVNKILIPMYWFKASIFGRDISRF